MAKESKVSADEPMTPLLCDRIHQRITDKNPLTILRIPCRNPIKWKIMEGCFHPRGYRKLCDPCFKKLPTDKKVDWKEI